MLAWSARRRARRADLAVGRRRGHALRHGAGHVSARRSSSGSGAAAGHLADPAAAWPPPGRSELPGPAGSTPRLLLLGGHVGAVPWGSAHCGADGAPRGPSAPAPAGPTARACVRCAAPRSRGAHVKHGWRSAGRAGACSTRSGGTRWSRSGRPSPASRRALPCRRCSSGAARRSPPRSRPTCSRPHLPPPPLGRCFVFDPFGWPGSLSDVVAACRVATSGMAPSRWRWRLAAAGELDQRGVEGGDFWAVAAEQRLAPLLYAAAALGRGYGCRRSLGLRPGPPRTRRGARAARRPATDERAMADARAAYDAARAFELRPIGRGRRSRAPPRPCCGPTGSPASRGRRPRARSPPTASWTRPPRCISSATPRRPAAQADLRRPDLRDRRPGLPAARR